MADRIENRNVVEIRALAPPREVKRRLPLGERAREVVLRARREIRDLVHGRDRERLLVVVGPCSIHDRAAALEYGRRLRDLADRTRDRLLVVMRTYFEKPRTVVGWKGLINDPHLDGSCDVATGLELARRILLELNDLGIPCGSELLDPVTPQYVADLMSRAAIGARTSASQVHREMASGLSMPVGFKNGTDGAIDVAVHAMIAAGQPHTFLGIDAEGRASLVRTLGNPDRHIVLRGGGGRPNYGAEDVARAAALIAPETVERPILIDCSHDNSGKNHTRQPLVFREVLGQLRGGQRRILGLLLESNLRPGNQTWSRNRSLDYGVSITDSCLGWEETEELLLEAARTLGAASRAA
jgi:3-deoxy-7-phosphoheptulonate synthase